MVDAHRYSRGEIIRAWIGNHRKASRIASDIVLLDTAMGSDNSGDRIIMDACYGVCEKLFGGDYRRVATHFYDPCLEDLAGKTKILCGTNILYADMALQRQWALPQDLSSFGNVCLLGVGLNDIGIEGGATRYTKWLLKSMLSRDLLHSVRDEKAKKFLNSIGFNNVLNTSCPTMWGLTPERIRKIPRKKADTVITSITDYCFDPQRDKEMLDLLKREYKRVVIWVQGLHDIDWCLSNIVDLEEFELIGPDIESLDEYLVSGRVDYVGTRLHAGIRSLSHCVRTLIIVVDNRARQIGFDTGLPVMERENVSEQLLAWIKSDYECRLTLPVHEITTWKNQFQKG